MPRLNNSYDKYSVKDPTTEESDMNIEAIDWPEDDETYQRVCQALFRDRMVDENEVKVEVRNGIVTLSGKVADRQARDYAVQSIENVFGVINVVNNLSLKKDRGLIGRSDGWPV